MQKPATNKRDEVYSARDGISDTARAIIKTTAVTAPAATVIGTLNRRQWSQAATDDIAPESIKDSSDKLPKDDCTKANTAPTNVINKTIAGSAIFRFRTKNSANPQDKIEIDAIASTGLIL